MKQRNTSAYFFTKLFVKIYCTLGIAIFLTVSCTNSEQDNQPKTPVFAGLEDVELRLPLTTATYNTTDHFRYNAPNGVAFLVFALFDAPITTADNKVSNVQNFKYGSRTGLSGFSAGLQTRVTLYAFDPGTGNFTGAQTSPPAGTYYWAVWGYDGNGNLTHSSPQRTVTLP